MTRILVGPTNHSCGDFAPPVLCANRACLRPKPKVPFAQLALEHVGTHLSQFEGY